MGSLDEKAHEPLEGKEARIHLDIVKMPPDLWVSRVNQAPEDLLVGQDGHHRREVVQRQNVLDYLC